MALSSDGKVYSWGSNQFGQLGLYHSKFAKNNSGEPIYAARFPVLIEDLVFEDDYVIDIAAGTSHCLALTSKQKVFLWGRGCMYPLDKACDDLNIKSKDLHFPIEIRKTLIHYKPKRVYAGDNYSAVLTTDGKLLTFGEGSEGQLGHLNTEKQLFGFLYEPKRVDALDGYFVEDVSLGYSHALAVAKKIREEDNKVEQETILFSWGTNNKGQCGTEDYGQSLLPRRVKELNSHKILQISAGLNHSLVVAEKDGESGLYTFGDASFGATALTKTLKGSFSKPSRIGYIDKHRKNGSSTALAKIIKIHAGPNSSFAIIESN